MTQRETWVMHFIVSAVICIGAWTLNLPQVGYLVIGFALGRERRDHEIKEGIPAREFHRHWDIWNWSTDGKADLATTALPAIVLLSSSLQTL